MLSARSATGGRGRLARVLVGLVLFGAGIGFMVAAGLGLGPWSVLDQGLARHTGLPIGTVNIMTGAAVLMTWIPLRERPGLGTLLNVVLVGLTTNAVLAVLPPAASLPARIAYLVIGVFLFGPGSGLYIGAGLGPGPRDGLMTGLVRRGVGSVPTVRTGLEVGVLAVGWLLGGNVGVGTVLFALTVGPNVHFFLNRFTVGADPRPSVEAGRRPAPLDGGSGEVGRSPTGQPGPPPTSDSGDGRSL